MLDTIKNQSAPRMFAAPDDITIGELLDFLRDHAASRLTFRYGGRTIRAGYHVTEVKAGQFLALDCGANPETWTELFVQLWDVDDSPKQMTAGKFAAIIRKVTEQVALDMSARLTFEVSDIDSPMQLFRAAAPQVVGDEVQVELAPRPASCKPRDRWLGEQKAATACCGSTSAKPCCA
jgi:hypothetical protein